MLLSEALEHLKAGKCMYRKGWNPQDGYVVFMKGMSHVWKIVLQPAPNAGNYIFSVEDLTADDWAEFEVPHEPVEVVAEPVAA